MKIDGVNAMMPQSGGTGLNQAMDSVSKNLQQQMERLQKQMQELSSNQEMDIEEKMKKRQEIQNQISSLNQQLRQHQIDLRRQKQQEKTASSQQSSRKSTREDSSGQHGRGMSQEGMKALVSADNAIEQSRVQGSVAKQMEGRANILKAEIKQDAARGADTQKKEEELADAEQTAANAVSAQVNTLEEANSSLEEASKAENPEEASPGDTEKPDTAKAEDSRSAEHAGPQDASIDVRI